MKWIIYLLWVGFLAILVLKDILEFIAFIMCAVMIGGAFILSELEHKPKK